jgi:hypothetical protein
VRKGQASRRRCDKASQRRLSAGFLQGPVIVSGVEFSGPSRNIDLDLIDQNLVAANGLRTEPPVWCSPLASREIACPFRLFA